MALFRRKQQPTTQIPELQEYYATQKSDNKAVAWLLAIGSLLVTVAIFIGLFIGGRWLYRTMTNTDDSSSSTSQTTDQANPNDNATTTPSGTDNSATINSGTVTVGGSGSTSTTAPTPAPGVSPSQSGQTNSSAVAANTNLPNSGPEHVVALFVLTTIAGSVLYRRVLVKR